MLHKAIALALGLALSGGAALAAPTNTAQAGGVSEATVVEPLSIVPVDDLRFGQIVRPTSAGTMTISTAGAVSTIAGVTGNEAIAQASGGRGAGSFTIVARRNASLIVFYPGSMTVANGGNTMSVSNMTAAIQLASSTTSLSFYTLKIGGRLNVAANQAVGSYSGTYTITAVYQ